MKNRRVLLLIASCWVTYLTAYLCRVNFSSAMDALQLSRGLNAGQLGAVGAVFYGVYALGQLFNGYIGDHVKAHRFILMALMGTCLCNVGMAFAAALPVMMLLWGVNGWFQSMFWSTLIRLLAQNTPAEGRAGVSSIISTAMPAAYFISWSLLGQTFAGLDSRWYFLVPAAISMLLLGWWMHLSRGLAAEAPAPSKSSPKETVRFLVKERMHILLLLCVLHGLIKEGVGYWTPLFIAKLDNGVHPALLAALLPIANAVGICLSKVLLKRVSQPTRILTGVMAGIACVSAVLALRGGMGLIPLMACISGLCYCSNTILMSYMPMQYAGANMVASIIGVLDCASYIGAAISTWVLGRLLAAYSFGPLPYIWAAAAILAAGISVLMWKHRKEEVSA